MLTKLSLTLSSLLLVSGAALAQAQSNPQVGSRLGPARW